MIYRRFEDTPAWQEAATLYDEVEELLDDTRFRKSAGFRSQLDRAALSVSNNIAEGFERGTNADLVHFLYIAKGSAGEVRSMLTLALRKLKDQSIRSTLEKVRSRAESCSRQLLGWAQSTQDSEHPGLRRLDQKAREVYAKKQKAAETQKKLLRMLPVTHPLRKDAEARGLL